MNGAIRKRVLPVFLSLLLLIGLMPSVALAEETVDGLKYTVSDDGVTITGYTGSETSITIPAEIGGKPVTSIGEYAFYNSGLESIEIPSGVTSIEQCAFYKSGLTSIEIPSGVTNIGINAFCDCASLSSVTFAEGSKLTEIGYGAFYKSGLTSIEIPSDVTSIGINAFYNCASLSSVTFAEGSRLTEIRENAFRNIGLQSIEIPSGVTNIGMDAFRDCASLSSITFLGKTAPILDNAYVFYSTPNLTTISIPDNATGYTTENYWSEDKIKVRHSTTHYEAQDATCTEDGNIEYWYCSGCDSYFSDADCQNKIGKEQTVKGATDHKWGDWQSNSDGTHTRTCQNCLASENGNCSGGTATCTALATCEICGQTYGEKNMNTHTGSLVWVQTETTHKQVYNCCQTEVSAEENHTWENGKCKTCSYPCTHTGGTATCTVKAVCEICGKAYGEVNASNHTKLVKTEAKPATHVLEGNIEYWHCDGCGKYFSDAAGAEEISFAATVIEKQAGHTADKSGWHSDGTHHWNTCECGKVINKAAHNFGDWTITKAATTTEVGSRTKSCTVCGYEVMEDIPVTETPKPTEPAKSNQNTDEKSPQTGDAVNLTLWFTLLLASAAGAGGTLLYRRKRKRGSR